MSASRWQVSPFELARAVARSVAIEESWVAPREPTTGSAVARATSRTRMRARVMGLGPPWVRWPWPTYVVPTLRDSALSGRYVFGGGHGPASFLLSQQSLFVPLHVPHGPLAKPAALLCSQRRPARCEAYLEEASSYGAVACVLPSKLTS